MIPSEAPFCTIGQDIYAKVTGNSTNEKIIKAFRTLCRNDCLLFMGIFIHKTLSHMIFMSYTIAFFVGNF
ncbi:MAG TPA: hypothetical protein VGK06_16730 [Methanosarcina sp.]